MRAIGCANAAFEVSGGSGAAGLADQARPAFAMPEYVAGSSKSGRAIRPPCVKIVCFFRQLL
jgi:hypothetical protein